MVVRLMLFGSRLKFFGVVIWMLVVVVLLSSRL